MAFMYYGKKYDTKAELKAAQKKAVGTKGKKKIGNIFEGRLAKEKRAAKASAAQGKRNQAATSKMYAAESMFKSAKNRDVAKTTPGKARSFKDAFDAANKANKDKFLHKGKSYFTTKGAADNRDKMKTRTGKAGSMSSAAPKKGDRFSRAKTKFGQSKTLKEFFSKLKKKK
tara:strand:- start:232 stop:744 length:513 start_codon:yes stop_codon:yes gene_type:complete